VTIRVLAWLFLRFAEASFGKSCSTLLDRSVPRPSAMSLVKSSLGLVALALSVVTLYDPGWNNLFIRTRGLKGERMATPPRKTSARPAATPMGRRSTRTAADSGQRRVLIYVVVLIIFGLVAIFDDHVSADRFV
jgi:hypothetical protein